MCRSIRKLRNSEPAPPEDIEAAALQFIRKVSGSRVPAKKNEDAFNTAVAEVTRATAELLDRMGLTSAAPNPPLGQGAATRSRR
jgi:hypothetical protein